MVVHIFTMTSKLSGASMLFYKLLANARFCDIIHQCEHELYSVWINSLLNLGTRVTSYTLKRA